MTTQVHVSERRRDKQIDITDDIFKKKDEQCIQIQVNAFDPEEDAHSKMINAPTNKYVFGVFVV